MEALHNRQVLGKAVVEVSSEQETMQEVRQRSQQTAKSGSAKL